MIVPLVVAFVALVAIATPVSIAMGLAAAVAILWGGKAPINAVVTQMVSGMDSFPLMAIPFFILAGELMERAGISEKLVHLAKVMVGHIKGGLGLVVLVGEYLFSGISGSTAADISAIGSLLIAPMERAGYKKGEAVAIVSAATAMGILVPPCIFMIVLASMTNQSIGAMFVAGFLPAIVIGAGPGGLHLLEGRPARHPAGGQGLLGGALARHRGRRHRHGDARDHLRGDLRRDHHRHRSGRHRGALFRLRRDGHLQTDRGRETCPRSSWPAPSTPPCACS